VANFTDSNTNNVAGDFTATTNYENSIFSSISTLPDLGLDMAAKLLTLRNEMIE
jgi:hypothetical protein